jgi:hypothetical protein
MSRLAPPQSVVPGAVGRQLDVASITASARSIRLAQAKTGYAGMGAIFATGGKGQHDAQ